MSALPTVYPFRQALSFALRALILSDAVPSINASLTAQMTATDPARIPQFGDASVTVGDLMALREPTICICAAGEDDNPVASEGLTELDMGTQIRIKTPWMADNAPEDFELFFNIITDTLRDLLNQQPNTRIRPRNGDLPMILGDPSFHRCRMTGARPMSYPLVSAEGVTRCQGWLITHAAKIEYTLSRAHALGQP